MVKIKFSSALRNATQTNEAILDVYNTMLKHILETLVQRFGDGFEKRILDKKI